MTAHAPLRYEVCDLRSLVVAPSGNREAGNSNNGTVKFAIPGACSTTPTIRHDPTQADERVDVDAVVTEGG
jgi:hypothetical protein